MTTRLTFTTLTRRALLPRPTVRSVAPYATHDNYPLTSLFYSSPPKPPTPLSTPTSTIDIPSVSIQTPTRATPIDSTTLESSHLSPTWGFIIYRCTYAPSLDVQWRTLKNTIRLQNLNAAPAETVDRMMFHFIEDPAVLEGAGVSELKPLFRDMVGGENEAPAGAGKKYFVRVDEEGLRGGYVEVVNGEEEEEGGDVVRVRGEVIDPGFYTGLEDEGFWGRMTREGERVGVGY